MDENEEMKKLEEEQSKEQPEQPEQQEMGAEVPVEPQPELPEDVNGTVEPDAPIQPSEADTQSAPEEKKFTQEELNQIVQQRIAETKNKAMEEGRRQALADLYQKYGVNDDGGLDDLFGNGQRYDLLNGEFTSQSQQLNELKAENALLMSGIDRSKFDDVKAILAYNKQEVTPMAIEQALVTHPEWKSAPDTLPAMNPISTGLDANLPPSPTEQNTSVIKKLGGEPTNANTGDDEQKTAMKLMGF